MRLEGWLPLLHETFGTKQVVVKVDADLARIEGIPRTGGVESDNVRLVKVVENGVRYEIDFSQGHKTGFFCDQRDNRKKFRGIAEGKSVLDLCCYSGGFSISAALGGASDVTAVDLDEAAVAMAKRKLEPQRCEGEADPRRCFHLGKDDDRERSEVGCGDGGSTQVHVRERGRDRLREIP